MKTKERPEMLSGFTKEMITGCGSLYVIVNKGEDEKPFELFARLGKAGGCAASQMEGIARLVSLALRSGIDYKKIVEQLKGISCHGRRSSYNKKKEEVLSCNDAIAKVLEVCSETFGGVVRKEKGSV